MNEKDNSVEIPNLSEDGFRRFRDNVKVITGSIKCQMSEQDTNSINTYLIGNLVMQFKDWMPRLLKERIGDFRYNRHTETYHWGRYRVAASELFQTQEGLEALLVQVGKNVGKLAIDLGTFGLLKTGVWEMNEEKAKMEYLKFKADNLDDPNIQRMTMEEFVETKQSQLKAMAVEARALAAFFMLILALGYKGDDDEPLWKETWFTRK